MRILVDIRQLSQPQQTGVGEYTIQLLRALFHLDEKNEYILCSTGRRKPNLEALFPNRPHNVSSIHVPVPNKLLNASIVARRQPTLDRLAGGGFGLVFLPNLTFATFSSDLPVVLTVHDLSWKYMPEFFSTRQRLWHRAVRPQELVARATAIVTPSEASKRDIARMFHRTEHVQVIPHGVDPSFSPKPHTSDHGVRSRLKLPRRYALFVGTLEPRKNLASVIEGMKMYREETRDDLHVVLAGSFGWKSRDIRHALNETSARGWMHHLGYVRAEDRAALYRGAQVFIWPSFYEGFGLPVLESMACGTPVIASATSSLPELTNGAAILVHPFRVQDVCDALRGLCSSPALQKHLSQAGIARAQDFSWKKSAEQTLNVFQHP